MTRNQVVDRLPLTIDLLLQSGLGKTVKYISEHPPTTGEFPFPLIYSTLFSFVSFRRYFFFGGSNVRAPGVSGPL
jgi:hypothetical protein